MGVFARVEWDALELLKLLNGKGVNYEPVIRGTSRIVITTQDVAGALSTLPDAAQAWAFLYANPEPRPRDFARVLSPLARLVRDALVRDRMRTKGGRTLDQVAHGVARSAIYQSIRGRGECGRCVGLGVVGGEPCTSCQGDGQARVTEQQRCDWSNLGMSRQAYAKWAPYELLALAAVGEWVELIRGRLVELVRG